MTLRQVNDLLRESELTEAEDPMVRLVCIIKLLRSMDQGEIATDAGVEMSIERFRQLYGEVSTKSVDEFVPKAPQVMELELDNAYILEVMGTD